MAHGSHRKPDGRRLARFSRRKVIGRSRVIEIARGRFVVLFGSFVDAYGKLIRLVGLARPELAEARSYLTNCSRAAVRQ
jgi:hypothetical protein